MKVNKGNKPETKDDKDEGDSTEEDLDPTDDDYQPENDSPKDCVQLYEVISYYTQLMVMISHYLVVFTINGCR